MLWTATLAAVPFAAASNRSLYQGPRLRPGPDALYRPPAKAPQLRNQGIWHAPPILVSGASAYRDSEFLYQDYLYDDHGAKGSSRDPGDPRASGDSFSLPNGSYTYPTASVYANNAADLVELRVKPLGRATAFRITLNTMRMPSLVGTTIAIGGSSTARAFPHGANATAPARLFLTVHGAQADLIRAGSGKRIAPSPQVTVSKRRRQIQVLVSHRAWDPGNRKVRLAAGVGLWDRPAGRYLIPGTAADAAHPGGAAGLSNPTAFFNVAFRYHEPFQHPFPPASVFGDPAWWRDREQGNALARGDLRPFHAQVDFGKLRRGVTDDRLGKVGGVSRRGRAPTTRKPAANQPTARGSSAAGSSRTRSTCPRVRRRLTGTG